VTLTQFGRGVPISGMNEKGLVVELLQLPAAEYDSKDVDRPYVNESQWAQYQLDRFGDVEDVLAHLGDVRIQRAYTGIHYFVADRSGRSATIEFLRGRAVVHTGVDLPVPVLTNDTYAESLESARWPQNGRFSALGGRRSEVRFRDAQRLTDTVKTTADADLSDLAWTILKAVRLNGLASDALLEPSQWNIVYDLKAGTIDFRTRGSKTLKRIDVNKVDLNEGAPELTADMNLPVKGDFIPSLRPYDAAANEALVRKNTLLFTLSGQRAKIAPAVDYGRVRSVGQ
jgi:choloylglycine hydrolase